MAEVSSAGCSQLCGASGGRGVVAVEWEEALDHYQGTVFHSSPREGTPCELSTALHYSVSQPQSRGIICSYYGTYLLASPANPRRDLAHPQLFTLAPDWCLLTYIFSLTYSLKDTVIILSLNLTDVSWENSNELKTIFNYKFIYHLISDQLPLSQMSNLVNSFSHYGDAVILQRKFMFSYMNIKFVSILWGKYKR